MESRNGKFIPSPEIIAERVLAVDPANLYREVVLVGEWPELGKIVHPGSDNAITLQREVVRRQEGDGYPLYGQMKRIDSD